MKILRIEKGVKVKKVNKSTVQKDQLVHNRGKMMKIPMKYIFFHPVLNKQELTLLMVNHQLYPDPLNKHEEILKKKGKKVWILLLKKIRIPSNETTRKSTIEAIHMMKIRNHLEIQTRMTPRMKIMIMRMTTQKNQIIINKINKIMKNKLSKNKKITKNQQ